jgi:hypothetical protein
MDDGSRIGKPAPESTVFYGEMPQGNIIKILFEAFKKSLERVVFAIREDGLRIVEYDKKETILYDCLFNRDTFTRYVCTKEQNISVRVDHISKQLKNVKKKNVVTFYIENADTKSLNVSIEGESDDSCEINPVTYCEISMDDYNQSVMPVPCSKMYMFPASVKSTEFQKVRAMLSRVKKVNLSIYESSGVVISGGGEGINTVPSRLILGKTPATNVNKFTDTFNSENFDMIIKLPGICNQIQFYAPKEEDEGYPIKIQINGSQNNNVFGIINIYIKTTKKIETDNINKDGTGYIASSGLQGVKRGRKKMLK